MNISIMGGSGYTGGELLRLLLFHPEVKIQKVTSQRYAGEFVHRVHPNLRGFSSIRFSQFNFDELSGSDIVALALPHGVSMKLTPRLLDASKRVIDLGADFRLKSPQLYEKYYHRAHEAAALLGTSVYGLPELHRNEIRDAKLVAVPGCMATGVITALAPLAKESMLDSEVLIVDAVMGSSGAGASSSIASHHAERFGGVRPYKVVGHRHTAEIEQELSDMADSSVKVAFSAHAVNMVRGILATSHIFVKKIPEEKELWHTFRSAYENEPFVRIVKDRKGLYRFPDPKVTYGTNFCDVGFELDTERNRVVVLSALDNLVKGAAGQAVQCLNIMLGLDERTGLLSPGFHPA